MQHLGRKAGGWRCEIPAAASKSSSEKCGCRTGLSASQDRITRRSAPETGCIGHVLDPRTGEPTVGALLAAVGHESATLTDALSTALLVLGAEGISLLAEQYPDADLLVAEETQEGVWFHSAGPGRWRRRLAGSE